ncbi:MAG: hypothetical protein WC621_02085 [Patescibacteria group bacterium]
MLARKKLSRQKVAILSGTIALVWIIIGGLLYVNFGSKPLPAPPLVGLGNKVGSMPLPNAGNNAVAGSTVKLPTDLLDNPQFKNLQIFGEVPLRTKELGRLNPFEPLVNLNSLIKKK